MLRAPQCGVLQRSYPVTILIPEKPRLRVAGRLKWRKTSLCSKIYVRTGPKNNSKMKTLSLHVLCQRLELGVARMTT